MATNSTICSPSSPGMMAGQTSVKTEAEPAKIKVNKRGIEILSLTSTAFKQGMEILSLTSTAFTGTNGILGAAPKISASTQAGATCLKVLGPAGAIVGWVNDIGILYVRGKELHELRKQIEALPDGEAYVFKHEILHALKKSAAIKVVTSTLVVASDTVSVPASFIPLIGLGANIGSVVVTFLQLGVDWRSDKHLKSRLERLTDEYREANTGMIQNEKAFVEVGQTLKDAHEKAKTDVTEAEKTLEKAMDVYRKHGSSKDQLPQVQAKQEELSKVEKALEAISFDIQEYETAKINFEAYKGALETIKDLDAQAKLEEEYAGTKQYVERFIKRHNSSFDTGISKLKDKQRNLKKELSLPEELDAHDRESGTPLGTHREAAEGDLRRVEANLYMFNLYPKACETLKNLEEQRAKLAEKMAAEKAAEQIKLQSMPISHDDLLTKSPSIQIPRCESEAHFHAKKGSPQLLHIKTERQVTPEEDEPKLVRVYSGRPKLTPLTRSTTTPMLIPLSRSTTTPMSSTSTPSSEPRSAKTPPSFRKLTRKKEKTAIQR